MFATAISQLRYASALILNRRFRSTDLTRIADDLVATIREFGSPGQDSQLLPGAAGAVDPEVRKSITLRNLRSTVRHAARETAYYRRLFQDLSLTPDGLSLDSFADLPVTPKAALRAAPGDFVSRRAIPALMATTTGTSGTPTVVWFSRDELAVLAALSTIGLVLGEGVRPHHAVAYGGCSRAILPLSSVESSVLRAGALFVHLGTVEPALALQRLAAPLGLPGRAPQITHVTVAASYLAALVEEAERDGWCADDFGLARIQVGGEVCSNALRERAERVLGAPVASGYLMTESTPFGGAPCEAGHLHFNADFGHLEVLDPGTGEPTAPGARGVLVVTPYLPYRECTPVLRYQTNDLVTRLPGVVDCSLAHLPATSDILGRYTGPDSLAVSTRDVLEILDADPGVPLPARFALVPSPAGPVLHVLVRPHDRGAAGRLEDAATAAGLAVAGIVVHPDRDDLPACAPLRADLREASFESTGTPAAVSR